MLLPNHMAQVLALLLAAATFVGCAGAPRTMSEQAFAERVAAHGRTRLRSETRSPNGCGGGSSSATRSRRGWAGRRM